MRRLARRSKQLRSRSSVKASRVSFAFRVSRALPTDIRPPLSEEFGIYLNYVRKLGFEEAPDYDFLRELFVKVMRNNGDIDDQVYDWNLLNGTPRYSHRYHAVCSMTGSQEEEDGSPLRDRTVKLCNRCRTLSKREEQMPPRKVPRSHHPLLLSAMGPRRANPPC